MSISTLYLSASTNRFSQAAHISPASLLAFASSSLVALWHLSTGEDKGIHQTLQGHETLVTNVRFASEHLLVTADDKGFVICWRKIGDQWIRTIRTQAHLQSISSICIFGDCLVTGSSDATVKVWKIENEGDSGNIDQLVERQTILQGNRYPLALALSWLPQSRAMILAVSGTDKNVNIWLRSSDDSFVHSASLAGHEDWVRSLVFRSPLTEGQPLILASGSQDATIRLWNIEKYARDLSQQFTTSGELSDELLDTFEASLGDIGDAEEGGRQISLKRHILTIRGEESSIQQFSVTFDALLIGHEAGITSLAWRPAEKLDPTPTLLSTSIDSSVILWSPSTVLTRTEDESNTMWINRQRFGDVGGQRFGGFVGGVWKENGNEAFAWETWDEHGAISGHRGPVKGLAWSPGGEYLISTGLDQTTRIHAPISEKGIDGRNWHELVRPQVHGYDLLDAAFLTPLKFISIADEKTVRVFEAPKSFVDLAEALHITQFAGDEHRRPIAANVPPLGLSNRPVADLSWLSIPGCISDYSRRPFESELAGTTLWLEIEKVFGHGYELITLGISTSRHLIATACKATTPDHAVIRIYNAATFRPVGQPLPGHSLTITRIRFSPNDRYILSVSRDRTWRLFELQENNGKYIPVAADKSHGRIIWDCAWSMEGDVFATASRDKSVKIWQQSDGKWIASATIKVDFAATAVDFAPLNAHNVRILAVGLETGEIALYTNMPESNDWQLVLKDLIRSVHMGHINRLAWCPKINGDSMDFASCSDDGTLRILKFQGDYV
ncbi:hypothetical protein AMATHDRAFT_142786 [Amanita thiersii Skay4041]|uniref:Elongator complex protein 2 n=1 Tax=Amanita thiersii Skay4041 TaxID=703135 RepID=A0A2A9NT67_9AGAR|nr:hypothetical protein AMATHDRAFT_142786 [Amanita thiersii Skay4041]